MAILELDLTLTITHPFIPVPVQSQLVPIFREVSDIQSWICSNTLAVLLSSAVRQALAARSYSGEPWKTLITHSVLIHAELSAGRCHIFRESWKFCTHSI